MPSERISHQNPDSRRRRLLRRLFRPSFGPLAHSREGLGTPCRAPHERRALGHQEDLATTI